MRPPPPGFEHLYSSNIGNINANINAHPFRANQPNRGGGGGYVGHSGLGSAVSVSGVPKPHTCRNCGLHGHLYKVCPHPTMSFGIICFRKHKLEGQPEYLMIQRKDSLSFMEFIRGKYTVDQTDYLKKLLGAMTHVERNLLLTSSFENMWNHVWYQPCIPKHTTEYLEAKRKYEALRNGFLNQGIWVCLQDLINQAPSPFTEPEWGFPKGRRRLREEDIDCAVREFCEETGFKPNDLAILDNIPPFEEIFYGTNNVLYRHVYYIAEMVGDADKAIVIDPKNVNQAREVRAVNWFPFQGTLEHIRNHNQERKTLFQQAHARVTEYTRVRGASPEASTKGSGSGNRLKGLELSKQRE